MTKTTIGTAVGAGAVALAAIWMFARPGEAPAKAEDGSARAATFTAEVATVGLTSEPRILQVTGTVRPEFEAQIAAKVMGRVLAVNAREGDAVRRGQALVSLDANDLDAAVRQAGAGVNAAVVGVANARVAAQMEQAASDARITAAQALVSQGEAAVKVARARYDLVVAGPRKQERSQASLAVTQARANLNLAELSLKRFETLVKQGAISRQHYDQARTQYEVAQAQLEAAQQSQSMTDEGSRSEDVRAAQEGLQQAEGALAQARAGLRQTEAAALQVNVRKQDIRGAGAQVSQSQAALSMARVARGYAVIAAPFDGVVSGRMADPGAMAAPGVPLLRVQGGAMRLEAAVPESALRRLRQGGRIEVALDATGGKLVMGTVAEIAPQGDAASHTFNVKIDLPQGAGARSGMFGRARIVLGTEARMLVASRSVVQREGLSYVSVVGEGSVARLRLITVGEADGDRLPVLSGLSQGDRIVADAAQGIPDGAKVNAQ
jgi:RND family efflux transporter MFP subunit